MKNIFTEHPHSVGETYWQHLRFASRFGFNMILGGFACLTHAFLPCLFKKTGSHFLLNTTYHFVDRMSTLEQRVLDLSAMIDAKKNKIKPISNPQ